MYNSAARIHRRHRLTITEIKYGALYNWYGIENIVRAGYSIPTKEEFATLITVVGGPAIAGNNLKETGTLYWVAPNASATNMYNFNLRGIGERSDEGPFTALNRNCPIWAKTSYNVNFAYYLATTYSYEGASADYYYQKSAGFAIRPIKISPSPADLAKADGQACDPYFDGEFYYRTVKIGTQVWVADHIKTRFYANGTPIPIITDNTECAALPLTQTGAMCYSMNDINNA